MLFVSSLQNPAKAPRKLGMPCSVLHDNAGPQSSKHTTQTPASLGYTVLPHPPYSPYLAPSDCFIQQNIRTNPQEKIPYQWWHGVECPQLQCRALKVTTEKTTVHRPWRGVCQKCYSLICRQSSTGGLWPRWVSILYEWPSHLLWWWFVCWPYLLRYKHTTAYRQSLCTTAHTDSPYEPLPKQCSCALTMTNFSDQWYNEHSTDSKTALFTLTAVGEMAHTGFDATNRCPLKRKLSFRTLI